MSGNLDALFSAWLSLLVIEHLPGKTDEQCELISDEMAARERAILSGEPETEDDKRAQLAILARYAACDETPYSNQDVIEALYQRLVVDRMWGDAQATARQHGRSR